ncbi:glycosyltransferase family 2 protein [Alteraurantiacibacter aestuarii]|uniref:glycosyltransferase family 2 protein n=1 Tax=Alteraurantiacibacter aestuarii TaxID=650004 RepID=UPI0031E09D5E
MSGTFPEALPATVVIPVRNEERNLPQCLAALGRFAHVMVVDSASTDRTGEIAAENGAQLIQFEWDGKFPKKRNWVLQTCQFSSPFVLFLDADEVVSPAFCDELAQALADTQHVGFWLNYTNYFAGRQLKHGVPQRKLALMRVGAGFYERIEEDAWSKLDMEVHEHPVLDGTIGEITAPIDHRDFRGIDKFLERHIDYAKWEAARYGALQAEGLDSATHLTRRQAFKYRNLGKWWYPAFYFTFAYILRGGIWDGRAGLLYAFYKAWYFTTIKALIAEAKR